MTTEVRLELTLWIAGKKLDGDNAWELQGVFATEEMAVAACVEPMMFVGPSVLNKRWPVEPVRWEGAYHPLASNEFGELR